MLDSNQKNYYLKFLIVLITIFAFVTRFIIINTPNEIIFDEVHYGKFASAYMRREYYFDVHPPLGKLTFACVGYLFSYDGWFNFDKIGASYHDSDVPYVAMRSVSAFFGTFTVLLIYFILVEMNFSYQTCFLGVCMIMFDNALITQSRLIVLDSQIIFYILATCYCWIRFRKCTKTQFSFNWWLWLLCTGFSLGAAISVKFVGLFIMASIGTVTLYDLFSLMKQLKITKICIIYHWITRFVCLFCIPIACFVFFYWIHLWILNKSGTGDDLMSVEFQSTLNGNKIAFDSVPILYNSKVTIKSKIESIYLSSNKNLNYSLIYNENKVSSEEQQVTGLKLINNELNEWLIFPIDNYNSTKPVKNGDFLRLQHYLSQKWLLTHDIASPLTLTSQEVIVVDLKNYNYSQTIWRIDILKRWNNNNDELILNKRSVTFRLVHNLTGCELFNFQKTLPDWAPFKQREINAVKNTQKDSLDPDKSLTRS